MGNLLISTIVIFVCCLYEIRIRFSLLISNHCNHDGGYVFIRIWEHNQKVTHGGSPHLVVVGRGTTDLTIMLISEATLPDLSRSAVPAVACRAAVCCPWLGKRVRVAVFSGGGCWGCTSASLHTEYAGFCIPLPELNMLWCCYGRTLRGRPRHGERMCSAQVGVHVTCYMCSYGQWRKARGILN